MLNMNKDITIHVICPQKVSMGSFNPPFTLILQAYNAIFSLKVDIFSPRLLHEAEVQQYCSLIKENGLNIQSKLEEKLFPSKMK